MVCFFGYGFLGVMGICVNFLIPVVFIILHFYVILNVNKNSI